MPVEPVPVTVTMKVCVGVFEYAHMVMVVDAVPPEGSATLVVQSLTEHPVKSQ